MELPKTKLPPATKSPTRMLLYGPPKVGKTSALAALDNCLIIDCESGSAYVEALKCQATTLEELENIIKEIVSQGKPYKYVAIDTIDVVEDWCIKRGTLLYKSSPQGVNFKGNNVLTLPNGAGYLWLRIAYHEVLAKIEKAAPRVILVGHLRDKLLEEHGKEVSAKDLDLTGKIKSITCAWADAIGLMDRDKEGKLYITFKTNAQVLCGARATHLKGKSFSFSYPEAKPEDWNQIYID